jgi:hypothetical protein
VRGVRDSARKNASAEAADSSIDRRVNNLFGKSGFGWKKGLITGAKSLF